MLYASLPPHGPEKEVLSIWRYPVDFKSNGEALLKTCSTSLTSLVSVGSGGEYCNVPLQVLAVFFPRSRS